MKAKTSLRLAALGLVSAGLVATGLGASSSPAMADYAPQPGDIVGVGGDTAQFAIEFAADGDYNGDAGFNAAGAYNRLVTFNATADANGRQAYAQGSTEAKPVVLSPTDVLRAGTYPVQRIASSGSAITALLADTSSPETINWVWSSSLPTSAQQTTASNNGWGYLHVVEFATDTVAMAADTTTNATPLSINELVDVYNGTYTKWSQIPGNTGASTDAIIPEIPPSGSSVYKTFLADLEAAAGTTSFTFGADVVTVEQNDPTAITLAPNPADAIVPFSKGRLNLWKDGYFHNPATAFPGSPTALAPGISLLTGSAPDNSSAYSSPITDYVIFRESDANISAPMEPGSARNWVQTLFSNPGGSAPYFDKASTGALFASSGVTWNYQDLGNVSSG